MSDNLKVDIINGAYSQLRISGITVSPSASDNVLALRRFENLMQELFGRNIGIGYNFEDTPDINSPHNLDPALWHSVECVLAVRLLSDFGKGMTPDPMLLRASNAGMSFIYSYSATYEEIQYPNRMPVGSGNSRRANRFNRFYVPVSELSELAKTNKMYVDDVQSFTEHFDSVLSDGETISSYTIEADTGLTVSGDSLTSPDITYTITAAGNNNTKSDSLLRVKIVATTSTSRKITRIVNFELITVPEIL